MIRTLMVLAAIACALASARSMLAQAGIPSRAGSDTVLPEYRPDPGFRLSDEARGRLVPWIEVRAVEEFLSAVPPAARADMLEVFSIPSGSGPNIAVIVPEPTGRPDWDRALGRIYAPLRELSREQGFSAWQGPGPVPFGHPDWRDP